MIVALDLDGCIDAAPRQFQSLMSALQAAGHTVVVCTGVDADQVGQQDLDEKAQYLRSLGCGACWDELVVLAHPQGEQLQDAKAAWLEQAGVQVFVDNNKGNAKAAMDKIPLVLVPWASRE